MIEASLYAHLVSLAVVGDRVAPLALPQEMVLPAVAFQRISTTPEHALAGGRLATEECVFQLTVIGPDHAETATIAGQLVDHFEGLNGALGAGTAAAYIINRTEDDDPETGLYRQMIDVQLLYKE